MHPYIRRTNGAGAGRPTPHPLMRTALRTDARRAAVPGAADADWPPTSPASPRPRPTSCAGRWGRSAPRSRWSGCGSGSTTAWRPTASPASSPTTSTRKLLAFANFGFPESHAISFAFWSTRARGSSATTRPRSARRCCAPSRWASTRRSRWSTTPAGTASRCSGRTSTPARVHATLEPPGRERAPVAGAGPAGPRAMRCARIGDELADGSWRNARRTGRTGAWPIWPAGSG